MGLAAPDVDLRPVTKAHPLSWLRKNLFNSWFNAVLTIVSGYLIVRFGIALISWLVKANWAPVTTSPILYVVYQYPQTELFRIGICIWIISLLFGVSWALWSNIIRNFAYMMIAGFLFLTIIMPFNPVGTSQTTLRLFMLSNILLLFAGYGLGQTRFGRARWVLVGWLLSIPIIVILLHGLSGSERLPVIETTVWGGLMLNLLIAGVGIGASFPLGVLLALG